MRVKRIAPADLRGPGADARMAADGTQCRFISRSRVENAGDVFPIEFHPMEEPARCFGEMLERVKISDEFAPPDRMRAAHSIAPLRYSGLTSKRTGGR